MTSMEPTETEELCGHVLGIIGAYGLGVSLDRRELYPKAAPATAPPKPVPVANRGYTRNGVVPRPA